MAQHLYDTRSVADSNELEADVAPNRRLIVLRVSSSYIALLAAWVATCGSLFFSEVLHWTPCVLCWYQRIFMYPLSILLAIGLLRRDHGLHTYVLPFSVIGACISLYHYLLQKTDWLPPPVCSIGVPCNIDYVNWFGFITIPFLALTAFLIISLMMFVSAMLAIEDADNLTMDASSLHTRFDVSRIAVFVIIATVILCFVAATRLI